MGLVIAIDLIVVIRLIMVAQSKGLEKALPFAAFVLACVPIESSLSLGFFELTTHRLIIGVLALLYMTRGSVNGTAPKLPLKVLILLHVVWCLISTANSIVPDMSIKKLLSLVLEYYVLYFIYFKTVSSVATMNRIIMAIAAAIVVCSVWGTGEAYRGWYLLQYFPPSAHHFDTGLDADRAVRVQSSYDHPILYGAALAMAITLTFYLLSIARTAKEKVFLWAGLMLMFLNIYQTSSRGPWLDAIIGCVLLLIFAKNKIRTNLVLIGALSLAVLIVRPGVWETIRGICVNTLNTESDTGSSYAYRFALQDAALNRLAHSPAARSVWGFGLESFYDLKIEGPLLGKPWLFLSCDNSWVELLLETGFVGLFIIVLLLFRPMWTAWRGYIKTPGDERYLMLVFFVNMLIFYFQMYSVAMYSWGQNGYLLWILIALTVAYPHCQEATEADVAALPIPAETAWGRPEWHLPVVPVSPLIASNIVAGF
jgi:O-antigen ligase